MDVEANDGRDGMGQADDEENMSLGDTPEHREEKVAVEPDDNVIDLSETLRKAVIFKKREIADVEQDSDLAEAERTKKLSRMFAELALLEKKYERTLVAGEATGEPTAEESADLVQRMVAFIKTYRITHVLKSNEWWIFEHGEWTPASVGGFFQRFNWLAEDNKTLALFHGVAEKRGRKLNRTHYAWADKPGYLNLLDMGSFCPAVECTSYHPMFDLLLRSLGGDKPENVEHIEKLITSKWLHPENYLLPCLVLGDKGGTGKGLFVSVVLGTVFGSRNVADDLSMEMVFGQFNLPIAGKAIAFVNEAPDYANDKGILRILGSKSVQIEGKGQNPIPADNTALYIIATNPDKGGHTIRLAHSDADRRFSIIFGKEPLKAYVGRFYGLPPDDDNEAGRRKVIDELQYVLADPTEVGKWLYAMVAKHGDVTSLPALHGSDFAKQSSETVDVITRVCEAVFHATDDDGHYTFDYIRGEVLFHLAVANGCRNSQINFYNAVRAWLTENAPAITEEPKKPWKDTTSDTTKKRKHAKCYIRDAAHAKTTLVGNDDTYGTIDTLQRWTWHIDVM